MREVQCGIDSRLSEVESIMSCWLKEVQQKIKACLEDVTGLLGRILALVGTKLGRDDALKQCWLFKHCKVIILERFFFDKQRISQCI